MCHPFFDELRVEGARMPNGKEFPVLFNFTREGETSVYLCRVLRGAGGVNFCETNVRLA